MQALSGPFEPLLTTMQLLIAMMAWRFAAATSADFSLFASLTSVQDTDELQAADSNGDLRLIFLTVCELLILAYITAVPP